MRKLENWKLDEIGRKLAAADRISTREIDEIVANPALFDSIRARIESEAPRGTSLRRSFLRPIIASGSSLALIAIAVFAFVTFKSKPNDLVKNSSPSSSTPASTDTKHSSKPDTIANPNIRTAPPVERMERAVERSSGRPIRPRLPVAQQARYEENFYALSYAGDPNETERGGRIVRVELSRSALFAMGINVPLENETATVKADLLIGNDGVTRGIRVVE